MTNQSLSTDCLQSALALGTPAADGALSNVVVAAQKPAVVSTPLGSPTAIAAAAVTSPKPPMQSQQLSAVAGKALLSFESPCTNKRGTMLETCDTAVTPPAFRIINCELQVQRPHALPAGGVRRIDRTPITVAAATRAGSVGRARAPSSDHGVPAPEEMQVVQESAVVEGHAKADLHSGSTGYPSAVRTAAIDTDGRNAVQGVRKEFSPTSSTSTRETVISAHQAGSEQRQAGTNVTLAEDGASEAGTNKDAVPLFTEKKSFVHGSAVFSPDRLVMVSESREDGRGKVKGNGDACCSDVAKQAPDETIRRADATAHQEAAGKGVISADKPSTRMDGYDTSSGDSTASEDLGRPSGADNNYCRSASAQGAQGESPSAGPLTRSSPVPTPDHSPPFSDPEVSARSVPNAESLRPTTSDVQAAQPLRGNRSSGKPNASPSVSLAPVLSTAVEIAQRASACSADRSQAASVDSSGSKAAVKNAGNATTLYLQIIGPSPSNEKATRARRVRLTAASAPPTALTVVLERPGRYALFVSAGPRWVPGGPSRDPSEEPIWITSFTVTEGLFDLGDMGSCESCRQPLRGRRRKHKSPLTSGSSPICVRLMPNQAESGITSGELSFLADVTVHALIPTVGDGTCRTCPRDISGASTTTPPARPSAQPQASTSSCRSSPVMSDATERFDADTEDDASRAAAPPQKASGASYGGGAPCGRDILPSSGKASADTTHSSADAPTPNRASNQDGSAQQGEMHDATVTTDATTGKGADTYGVSIAAIERTDGEAQTSVAIRPSGSTTSGGETAGSARKLTPVNGIVDPLRESSSSTEASASSLPTTGSLPSTDATDALAVTCGDATCVSRRQPEEAVGVGVDDCAALSTPSAPSTAAPTESTEARTLSSMTSAQVLMQSDDSSAQGTSKPFSPPSCSSKSASPSEAERCTPCSSKSDSQANYRVENTAILRAATAVRATRVSASASMVTPIRCHASSNDRGTAVCHEEEGYSSGEPPPREDSPTIDVGGGTVESRAGQPLVMAFNPVRSEENEWPRSLLSSSLCPAAAAVATAIPTELAGPMLRKSVSEGGLTKKKTQASDIGESDAARSIDYSSPPLLSSGFGRSLAQVCAESKIEQTAGEPDVPSENRTETPAVEAVATLKTRLCIGAIPSPENSEPESLLLSTVTADTRPAVDRDKSVAVGTTGPPAGGAEGAAQDTSSSKQGAGTAPGTTKRHVVGDKRIDLTWKRARRPKPPGFWGRRVGLPIMCASSAGPRAIDAQLGRVPSSAPENYVGEKPAESSGTRVLSAPRQQPNFSSEMVREIGTLVRHHEQIISAVADQTQVYNPRSIAETPHSVVDATGNDQELPNGTRADRSLILQNVDEHTQPSSPPTLSPSTSASGNKLDTASHEIEQRSDTISSIIEVETTIASSESLRTTQSSGSKADLIVSVTCLAVSKGGVGEATGQSLVENDLTKTDACTPALAREGSSRGQLNGVTNGEEERPAGLHTAASSQVPTNRGVSAGGKAVALKNEPLPTESTIGRRRAHLRQPSPLFASPMDEADVKAGVIERDLSTACTCFEQSRACEESSHQSAVSPAKPAAHAPAAGSIGDAVVEPRVSGVCEARHDQANVPQSSDFTERGDQALHRNVGPMMPSQAGVELSPHARRGPQDCSNTVVPEGSGATLKSPTAGEVGGTLTVSAGAGGGQSASIGSMHECPPVLTKKAFAAFRKSNRISSPQITPVLQWLAGTTHSIHEQDSLHKQDGGGDGTPVATPAGLDASTSVTTSALRASRDKDDLFFKSAIAPPGARTPCALSSSSMASAVEAAGSNRSAETNLGSVGTSAIAGRRPPTFDGSQTRPDVTPGSGSSDGSNPITGRTVAARQAHPGRTCSTTGPDVSAGAAAVSGESSRLSGEADTLSLVDSIAVDQDSPPAVGTGRVGGSIANAAGGSRQFCADRSARKRQRCFQSGCTSPVCSSQSTASPPHAPNAMTVDHDAVSQEAQLAVVLTERETCIAPTCSELAVSTSSTARTGSMEGDVLKDNTGQTGGGPAGADSAIADGRRGVSRMRRGGVIIASGGLRTKARVGAMISIEKNAFVRGGVLNATILHAMFRCSETESGKSKRPRRSNDELSRLHLRVGDPLIPENTSWCAPESGQDLPYDALFPNKVEDHSAGCAFGERSPDPLLRGEHFDRSR